MLSSFFSGISGLIANSSSINVVGNNIANVNTVGFKGSRATFEDVLYQSISGTSGSSQVGRGTALSSVDTSFGQGSFESTSESTDLAIGG
jgi:flagellar hook protein FlgE